jgi:hypothetical protein
MAGGVQEAALKRLGDGHSNAPRAAEVQSL